ncbi:MAG: L,D-transpeptidase family protein, partial [Planctomycetota bacterium]
LLNDLEFGDDMMAGIDEGGLVDEGTADPMNFGAADEGLDPPSLGGGFADASASANTMDPTNTTFSDQPAGNGAEVQFADNSLAVGATIPAGGPMQMPPNDAASSVLSDQSPAMTTHGIALPAAGSNDPAGPTGTASGLQSPGLPERIANGENGGAVTANPWASGVQSSAEAGVQSNPNVPTANSNTTPGVAPNSVAPPATAATLSIENALATADRQYGENQKVEALSTLSVFYDAPTATPQQQQQLISRLNALAFEVIYSRDHLLEKPHIVADNETLTGIAAKYEVPWQLLANINGIQDTVTMAPGTELKVVRGPFRGEINLSNSYLTLFLNDRYAGRFPIRIAPGARVTEGILTVMEKQTTKVYIDANGTPIPPGDRRNPYGGVWMDLGNGLSLHGSPDPHTPSSIGCISIADANAADVYGILSQGSSITVHR